MVDVGSTGITGTSLQQYIDDFGSRWRAVLGPDLSLDAETPQGQIIAAQSIILEQVDEAIQALGNARSLARSVGIQVDDLGSLLGIDRRLASKSSVMVTLVGRVGAVIRQGARASTASGEVFELRDAVTIPAGGKGEGVMVAVDAGPIEVGANELTMIVDLISGWESVTNPAPAVIGRVFEEDTLYKARYPRRTSRLACGSIGAVESRVLEVDGVDDVLVRDNSTTGTVTEQGQAIPARSLYVAVKGGSNTAVAQAIADSKSGGQPTVGATSQQVNAHDMAGRPVDTYDIRFDRVAEVPVAVTAAVAARLGFPSDATDRMTRAILGVIEDLEISDPVEVDRVRAAMLTVPHHSITSLAITRKSGNAGVTNRKDLGLNDLLTLASADIKITVS